MLRILCLLICMITGPVFAQQQNDLYHTEVQLTGSEEAESIAKQDGLVNVLIKVSGKTDIAQNEVIKKALTQSNRYVTQMSFVEYDDAPRAMKLGYNSKMVLSLLTQAEQSIWETPRKSVLVWVVNEYNYQRSIIWEQSNNSLITRIKDAANERGLPVMFPVGDFDDVTSIEIPDLWGNFKKPIADASERYNPQAILVVKVRGNSSTWTLFDTTPQYLVTASKKPIEGRVSGSVQLADMVNEVSDYFAKTYTKNLGAVASDSETVSIQGIHTTRAFFSIEKQLKQMNSVASVQVNTIQGDKVTYTLSLLGDYQQFNDELLSKNARISLIPEEPVVNDEIEKTVVIEGASQDVAQESEKPVANNDALVELEEVKETTEAKPVVREYQLNAS
ncbi:DUF2066 domain-containing protein [Aliivibrio sp. S4TY2]|uniref:DUF2066 domain-containing protein n=1 Tax=unclassified Aliivibrio TaxID=2645654 RepID=UPI00237863F7|nr:MULTISPECIES: DUF2066 domain-containing protein [unclassified Aliivibrio]MDD9154854.1 DUF2066 domain-containing protein [Aliivibrio sp. S4TY2]MDD9158783.1 DUF2066 domain-containing protein [Aliivibrio sp. S4TY1]MDD9162857.1 DUF2066 domain-containing protein [Aliivibrio sp. S4MY2]MDD9166782.1 DUF2066 domain-containing protein [Aliivibrio sp. S4MY4]MDD9183934.1 DUF2066 domain-containing protein [Aliivibrio sp. S4MY3]